MLARLAGWNPSTGTSRLDIDREVKDFKAESATEQDVKEKIKLRIADCGNVLKPTGAMRRAGLRFEARMRGWRKECGVGGWRKQE